MVPLLQRWFGLNLYLPPLNCPCITQDCIEKHADIKPRTIDWLIKVVDSVYKAKISLDEHRSKMGQEPLHLIEALFAHLTGVYGTKELVNQYAAQVIATLEEFRGVSLLKLLTVSLQSGFPF